MMTQKPEEDSWRLIETAPRDGTKIILYGKQAQSLSSTDGLLVTFGHYLIGLDCWITEGGVIYDATHWMPLPEPQAHQRPKRKTEGKNEGVLKKIQGRQRLRCGGGVENFR